MFSDELILISNIETEIVVDDNGFPIERQEIKRNIFANKISISSNEFYKSQLAGFDIVLKFEVNSFDFNGEEYAEYQTKRYKIERTFTQKNNEITELTLSKIKCAT